MGLFKKGIKKLIVITLSLAIVIPLFTTNVLAETDISSSGDYIKEWMDRGLINGYGDGTFRPGNNITRAEFMNLVNKAFNYSNAAEIEFKDVKIGAWYYSVVQKAVAAGYINGYSDGTIKPNAFITNQEAASIISKISNLKQENENPKEFLKRGEAVVKLNNALEGRVIESQSISGKVFLSDGSSDLTTAKIQLKKDNVNIGAAVNPKADGTYQISGVKPDKDYTLSISLEGYYDFTTDIFNIEGEENIVNKNIQIARKEPIITTQDITTITKGTNGVVITIDLTSGMDYELQVLNLGHKFAKESIVENKENWEISTGITGLKVDSIKRIDDTQVKINFTGEASKARAFTIKALDAVIDGAYSYDSNELVFSITDDNFMKDTTGKKELYYAINKDIENIKGIVVLSHGLAEHLGRYNEVAESLNQAGYGVYRIDHKGHGRTGVKNSDKGIIAEFADYYKDLDLLVDKAILENPNKPIYMLGHSMGGLIAAMYGVTYTDKLDGQILSGAATGPYYLSFGLEEDFYNRFGGNSQYMVPNTLTSTVCRYPAIQSYYFVDPLRLTEFTAQLYWKTFAGGSKYLNDKISEGQYTYPVFIIHGEDDRIVSKSFSENLFKNINSVDKKLKLYNGLFHESLNEKNEKEMVMKDIINWLDEKAK